MCSGRGYHVLGDFSFKTIIYEFPPKHVYLFMYPFIDGNLALWHARAPARIVSLVCVSAVDGADPKSSRIISRGSILSESHTDARKVCLTGIITFRLTQEFRPCMVPIWEL